MAENYLDCPLFQEEGLRNEPRIEKRVGEDFSELQ